MKINEAPDPVVVHATGGKSLGAAYCDMDNVEHGTSYEVRIISEMEDFYKLRPIWDEFALNHESYVPFLCFDFISNWLKHFLNESKLFIMLCYNNQELIAIAPYIIKQVMYKGINIRKIESLGNIYNPVRAILFEKKSSERQELVIRSILAFLRRTYRQWDLLDMNSIPVEDDYYEAFNRTINSLSRMKKVWYTSFLNMHEDRIDDDSTSYLKSLSKNFRASIRKNAKKAERIGNLSFKMISTTENLDHFMDIYFAVYGKSWKVRERVGPWYYRDLTKCFAEKGWLRLGLLFLDDTPVACGFAVAHNGVAYFEKTAYDERYEEIGAGKLWHVEMLKHLIDIDHVRGIDLLYGDYEYKRNWVSKKRERKGVTIFNSNGKGMLLYFLEYLKAFKDRLSQLKGDV